MFHIQIVRHFVPFFIIRLCAEVSADSHTCTVAHVCAFLWKCRCIYEFEGLKGLYIIVMNGCDKVASIAQHNKGEFGRRLVCGCRKNILLSICCTRNALYERACREASINLHACVLNKIFQEIFVHFDALHEHNAKSFCLPSSK